MLELAADADEEVARVPSTAGEMPASFPAPDTSEKSGTIGGSSAVARDSTLAP